MPRENPAVSRDARRYKVQSFKGLDHYWSLSAERLFTLTRSSPNGLSDSTAKKRLVRFGPNTLRAKARLSALRSLGRQFASPLVLILIFAAFIAGLTGDWTDAGIIVAIVVGSGLLSFVQEHQASLAVEALRQRVRVTSSVLRGGNWRTEPSEGIVPGDVISLSAGSLVPADGVILDCKDFFVTQSAHLTVSK